MLTSEHKYSNLGYSNCMCLGIGHEEGSVEVGKELLIKLLLLCDLKPLITTDLQLITRHFESRDLNRSELLHML